MNRNNTFSIFQQEFQTHKRSFENHVWPPNAKTSAVNLSSAVRIYVMTYEKIYFVDSHVVRKIRNMYFE